LLKYDLSEMGRGSLRIVMGGGILDRRCSPTLLRRLVSGARLDLRSVLLDKRGAMDMRCFLVFDVGLELVDSKPPAIETRRLVDIPPNVVLLVFTMIGWML